MQYVIDIETNGLLSDMIDTTIFPYQLKPTAKLWCVVITDVNTKVSQTAVKEEITKEWLISALSDCEVLIAHNGIKFDFLVLKLFGVFDYHVGYINEQDTLFGKPVKFVDTLIYSRLFNPDRQGGHSLDNWGNCLNNLKIDYRQTLIDNELLDKHAKKGEEFQFYTPLMLEYCIQDTYTNISTYLELDKEVINYPNWKQSIKVEHKLADLAINRETLGFWFDKELAIKNLNYLTGTMNQLAENVNCRLPKRKRNKGEMKEYIPPKKQLKKDNSLSSLMEKFIEKIGATHVLLEDEHYLFYKNKEYKLPYEEPLINDIETTIDNLDAIKMYLIDSGWIPTQWKERDLTRDSKKQLLPYEKRVEALIRWLEETMEGKYKKHRLEHLNLPIDKILPVYKEKLLENKPVKVYTSPCVRVGVDKELCPNLIKLGSDVDFVKDFALYLTYKHRKNSIAGGEIEDLDFDTEFPNTGYLANYRTNDERISTPAIELGAATNRYKHIGVANIPRASSIFGKEMRSMFGSGANAKQLGFDFASLEARIQGHYIMPYKGGKELAEMLLAEKPNDIHCFSEDTEILTTQGWKYIKNINKDTLLYQYNVGERVSITKPIDLYEYEYEGIMYYFQHDDISFNVTPEHRCYLIDSPVYTAEQLYHETKDLYFLCGEALTKQVNVQDCKKEQIFYNGKVYCVSVPSTYVIIKHNNKVSVSGNSVTARELNIRRDDAKSINYAIIYGASPFKLQIMLNITANEAKKLYNKYWETKPSLKKLKDNLTAYWQKTGKKYILSIDKRKIYTRSEHSLLNALFQSAGVICAKYVTVCLFESLEKQGYIISPFIGKPDVCSMIEYHDENQLYVNPELIEIKEFDDKENAKQYLANQINSSYQYSAISFNEKLNKFIVCPPNVISKTLNNTLEQIKKYLNLRVDIGIEWIVGDNWYECH